MSMSAKPQGPTVLSEAPDTLGPIKMVKIQQTESGPFNVSNNLCSIEFDGENVTDLKRSYLDLHLKLTLPNEEVVPDCKFGDLATGVRYMASSLFKTVTLKSENVGMVEQMRYQNVHSETMKQFYKYSQEEDASDILNASDVLVDDNGEAHVIVPIKDILPGCGNSMLPYPNNRMGPSILELEFENNKPVVYSAAEGAEVAYTVAGESEDGDVEPFDLTEITLTQPFESIAVAELYFMAGDKKAQLACSVGGDPEVFFIIITGVAVDPDNLTTTITFTLEDGENLEIPANTAVTNIIITKTGVALQNSKAGDDVTGNATDETNVSVLTFTAETDDFVIGQDLFVAWLQQSAAGLADNDAYQYGEGVIADVEVNAEDPTKVDVTFEDTVFTIQPGFNATQIHSFVDLEPNQLVWSISEVDLVLVKPIKQFQVPEYEIKPYNLEMVNLPANVPFFRRQYELEESCDLVQLLNPVDTLVSTKQFNAYRNALNSIQTTTQDVVIDLTNNGSLYYDRWLLAMDDIKRLQFRNSGLEVAAIAEAVTPQVGGLPNNVLEFQLMDPLAAVQSSMLYCYKRITRVF